LNRRTTVDHLFAIPNILSFLRIILTPVLVYVFMQDLIVLAAVIFTLAAMTDLLDGYYARRYGVKTRFGAFLDPIADKILISTTLFLFVYNNLVPWVPISMIVFRDIVVTCLRLKLIYNGTSLVTSDLGKSKTFIQFLTIACMFTTLFIKQFLAPEYYTIVLGCLGVMVWAVALITLYSGIDYVIQYIQAPRKNNKL